MRIDKEARAIRQVDVDEPGAVLIGVVVGKPSVYNIAGRGVIRVVSCLWGNSGVSQRLEDDRCRAKR